MGLLKLIEDVKSKIGGDYSEINSMLQDRTVFQGSDSKDNCFKVNKLEYSIRSDYETEEKFYRIFMHLDVKTEAEKALNLVREFLEKSQKLRLEEDIYTINHKVIWELKEFLEVEELGDISSGDIEIKSYSSSRDPSKSRGNDTVNSLCAYAKSNSRELEIDLGGNHRNIYKEWANLLNPWLIFRAGGSFPIPAFLFKHIPTNLGRPLLGIGEKNNGDITLVKFYKPENWNNSLIHMKEIAGALKKADLGVAYGEVTISESLARSFLEKEIEEATHYYNNLEERERLYAIPVTSISHTLVRYTKWGNVKGYAKALFGEEIYSNIEELNVNEYVKFLEAEKYKEEEIPDTLTKDNHIKQKHLLELVKQFHSEEPDKLIEWYRSYYVNKPPSIEVIGKSGDIDGSRSAKLELPDNCTLTNFGIYKGQDGKWNHNALGIDVKENNRTDFWLITNVHNPELIELQEYFCKELGISFK